MIEASIQERVFTKKGRVLLAVAAGEDSTKLDLRERTGLSMSTVISCVDTLVQEGLVTLDREKTERGGKPHSAINVRADRCVYGITYKSGVLTGTAIDLKGESRRQCSLDVREGHPPPQEVLSLASALSKAAPSPSAIGLAVNCEEREEIAGRLEDRFGAPTLLTTNTAAVAYRAFWEGSGLPVVAIGVGNALKCVCLEKERCRVIDLSDMPSASVFTEQGSYRDLLAAYKVERVLRKGDYGGHFEISEAGFLETLDQSSYTRALARAIASLSEIAERVYAPRKIRLFGEYITQGFFDRIRAFSRVGASLSREKSDGSLFAYGTALCALTEAIFN